MADPSIVRALSLVRPLLLLVIGVLCCAAASRVSAQEKRLWLVGDSTVRNGVNGGVGWGDVVSGQFDTDRLSVVNRAIGGRSSRSYYRDHYESVKTFTFGDINGWVPGDYLILQFGHNDGGQPFNDDNGRPSLDGVGDESVTITRGGSPEEVRTFGWYLRQMIQEAEAAELIPIVASYVPRAGDTNPVLSSYGLWAQQVAQQEGVAFIDLYGTIIDEYNARRATRPRDTNYIRNTYFGPDSTHTNHLGATLNAEFVARNLRTLSGPAGGLQTYLAVPEPSAAILFGLVAPCMFAMRRRR